MTRISLFIAALFGALGVAIGAYHAHGLQRSLELQELPTSVIDRRMANCETAVRYQLIHGAVLLTVAVWNQTQQSRVLNLAQAFWILGTSLFSGGLYLMVFTGRLGHWTIVPSGGMCLIFGWLVLAVSAFTPLVSGKNALGDSR